MKTAQLYGCKIVCPENQVLHMVNRESIMVADGECTNCGRCIDVCGDNALEFNIKKFYKKGENNG